jgi:SAM-dependent methyltransferase
MIAAADRATTWHDVECGAYVADLPLWSQLAREAAGPVLDLGAGTGRVALHLAADGFEVTALDRAPELLAALSARARERGLNIEAVRGDARDFSLSQAYALVMAPMQLAHVVGGAGARSSMLAAVRRHLRPGGRAAFALLGELPAGDPEAPPPLPDVLDREGWVFSSQPLEVVAVEGGLEIRRLRQLVSPSGELESELDAIRLDDVDAGHLASEAREAGMREVERIEVPPTPDHVGSVVCVLEGCR